MLISFFNVIEWTSGKAIWSNLPTKCGETAGAEEVELEGQDDCVSANYDENIVSKVHPPIYHILVVMIVFQICLDIAIFKWRWLADWIFFENRVFWFLYNFIPSNQFIVIDLSLLEWHFQAFALFYTDNGAQIIFNTCVQLAASFIQLPLIY